LRYDINTDLSPRHASNMMQDLIKATHIATTKAV